MSSHVDGEFQRILSNPENEIISDSLRERLRSTAAPITVDLLFENATFECTLDSFVRCSKDDKLTRISMVLGSDVALNLLKGVPFNVKCDNASLDIDFNEISSINCFRHEGDIYILELELSLKGVLND